MAAGTQQDKLLPARLCPGRIRAGERLDFFRRLIKRRGRVGTKRRKKQRR